MKHYGQFYIDGEWVDATGDDRIELINPATEQPFATVARGTEADVDRAVKAARRALPKFSATPKEERVALLERIINEIQLREGELSAAVTQEMGSPVSNKTNFNAGIASLKQAIKTLREFKFEEELEGNIIRREAIGVCGLITAWNWPVQLLCTKVSSALAAGCTVVLKPSEFTPTCAIIFAEALHAAGVPKGVFNLIVGQGTTVGTALCTHPDIDMVSITGSTRAGIQVAKNAADTVKRVTQELGGKSANVVLPDADLAAAAKWNVARGFGNSGQSCHAPTRILVQRDQVEPFLDHLRGEVEKIRVGDPLDPATDIGPVINRSQFESIRKYIRIGLEDGGRLVCGGPDRPDGIDTGFYIRPTVFADVGPQDRIAQEEIFGPVLAVIAYDTEDEAAEIANGTPYGLGGFVFAGDPKRGLAMGRRIKAGRVSLNGATATPAAPMGGYGQSGNGREMGVFGLEEYLEVKALIGFPEQAFT